MVASSDSAKPQNVEWATKKTKLNLLRTAAIYGANASGKSNFISAMGFMRQFVLNSHRGQQGDTIPYRPFKLDPEFASKPSVFEIKFIKKGIRYVYGMSLDARDVQREWFHEYPKGQRRILFERYHSKKDEVAKVKFGSHWSGEKKGLIPVVRHNALFLSIAAQYNHAVSALVLEWFRRGFRQLRDHPINASGSVMTAFIEDDAKFKQSVKEFLVSADLGIDDYRVIFKMQKQTENGVVVQELTPEEAKAALAEEKAGALQLDVVMLHRGRAADGKATLIPFFYREESDGTRKLFTQSGPITNALTRGTCLFVDELDVKLHPHLTSFLIRLFQNDKRNKGAGQLIFTTHNADLLEEVDLFRRDQVWITEKGSDGGSTLYSLWSISGIRKGENLRKGYLSGRYGGVPIINE
jgi:AAA15 family ATPase/GTPase